MISHDWRGLQHLLCLTPVCSCPYQYARWRANRQGSLQCLQQNSEQELFDLQKQADEAGIVNALILDNGATEFHGKKTFTCLAIGPDISEKIDIITKDLKLL